MPTISNLPTLENPTDNTILPVVDVDVNPDVTKKITLDQLKNYLGYLGSGGGGGTGYGYTGSKGFVGSHGAYGARGYAGSRGNTGYVGSVGTGAIGYTGSASAGYNGSKGYVGSAGADGTSVTILGSVNSYLDLPGYPDAYVGDTGDGYLDVDGYLWIWTGAEWQNVGQIIGPQGNTGYFGSQGYTGSIGYIGSRGYTGSQGYTGSAGAGYTGSASTQIGYTGSQGYTGSRGYTGSAGYVGSQGYAGSRGYTGSRGATGYMGSNGLGIGQDWGSYTSSRTTDAIYRNTTGGPIAVAITVWGILQQYVIAYATVGPNSNGANNVVAEHLANYYAGSGQWNALITTLYFIVPDDHYYKVYSNIVPSSNSLYVSLWRELR